MSKNQVYKVSTNYETYDIIAAPAPGNNDVLLIRFNKETAWTTVTLTAGIGRTAAQIATDINTTYGSAVASDSGGLVKIQAPYYGEEVSEIYIATAVTGSTAAATLGFTTSDTNPIVSGTKISIINSDNYETYNITNLNNTFIFKFNFEYEWTVATLTIGAARTAQEIVDDLNTAYQQKTSYANKAFSAVEPIAGSGDILIRLTAPKIDNVRSAIYIKETGNTALTVLGFSGNDTQAIVKIDFPVVPVSSSYYNPILAETEITFAGAGTKYFYLMNPDITTEVQFIRVHGDYLVYIDSLTNTPPLTINLNETFFLTLPTRVEKFIIIASAIGHLSIRELR
jgi:hypothetical protein